MLVNNIYKWKSFNAINEYGDEATSSLLDYSDIMAYVNSMDSEDKEDNRDDGNYLSNIKNIDLPIMNGSISDNI